MIKWYEVYREAEIQKRGWIMYVEAIIIGLIVGLVRNGRMVNLFSAQFKAWGLIIPAFALFLVPFVLKAIGVEQELMHLFPFAAMGICLLISLINFHIHGMKVIFLGLVLNMTIMALSHFKMPVDTQKMVALGFSSFVESIESGAVINYVPLSGANPAGAILGKVIGLPKAYPLAQVLSVGDIAVSLGIAMTIQYQMLLSSVRMRSHMLRFNRRRRRW